MTSQEWVAKILRHRTVLAERILILASVLWSAGGSNPTLERSADHQSRGAAFLSQNDRADSAMGAAIRNRKHSSDNFNACEIILEDMRNCPEEDVD